MSHFNTGLSAQARTIFPSAAVFVLTASFVLTKTARDALYIQDAGLSSVALGFMFIALLSIPQARFVLQSITSFGPRKTRVGMQLAAAVALAVYAPLATPGVGLLNDIFFVAVPLVFSVLFSMTWLLTSELVQGQSWEAVARAYSRVAAASMLGGALGAAFAGQLGAKLGPAALIVAGATGLTVTALLTIGAHMKFPLVSAVSEHDTGPAGFRDVLSSRYIKLLMAIAVAGAFAAVMIEFRFYAEAAMSGRDGAENANYFANVYFLVLGHSGSDQFTTGLSDDLFALFLDDA